MKMKKNDLVKHKGKYLRVLFIKQDTILVIDCLKKNMPYWVEDYEEENTIDIDDVYKLNKKLKEDIEDLSPARRKTAYNWFAIIADLVVSKLESNQSEYVDKVIEFVLSEDGQYLIEKTGYGPLDK